MIIERLAFYGIAVNLISYLTTVLHEGTAASITSVWNWGGVAWITPLIGGFLADAYLGRFKTILIGLSIYQVVCMLPALISMQTRVVLSDVSLDRISIYLSDTVQIRCTSKTS